MKRGVSTVFIVIYVFAMLFLAVVALGSMAAVLQASQDTNSTGKFTPAGALAISLVMIAVLTWRLVVHARARTKVIRADAAETGEVR